MKSVLYVQFTNPTAYPPLEYSARVLKARGWRIRFVGVRWHKGGNFEFGSELDKETLLFDAPAPGWKQKLFYLKFSIRALQDCVRMMPSWVYISDPLAAPFGWVLKKVGFRVIYHEHDTPEGKGKSLFMIWILAMRKRLVRIADLIVIPQHERARHIRSETGTRRPIHVVWNCPMSQDVSDHLVSERSEGEPMGIYFHGSLNLDRVPLTLIEGVRRSGVPVLLRIVGYETIGSQGVTATLRKTAEEAKVSLETPGSCPRHELHRHMRGMHVGWIACGSKRSDFNLQHLAGASNKAFDYLAGGLALLVTKEEAWQSLFEVPGYAQSCNPEDPDSIAAALRWMYAHSREVAAMASCGRDRVAAEWNYESQFEKVAKILEK